MMYAIDILMILMMIGQLKDPGPVASGKALSCDAALAGLFTPARPEIGEYQVCTTLDPPDSAARPDPNACHYGSAEALDPLDAFGAAGSYDRARVARLYGGRRARVVHGWCLHEDTVESLTLISPYPDRSLTQLLPGSLVIRYTLPFRH
jgi:hypothetical protein